MSASTSGAGEDLSAIRILSLPNALIFMREGIQAQVDRLHGMRKVAFEAYKEMGDVSVLERHLDPSEVASPEQFETCQGALAALIYEVDQLDALIEQFAAA